MKKLILTFSLIAVILISANASKSDLFTYDQNAVNTELSQLTTLENYVYNNEGVTYSQVLESNSAMAITNMNGLSSAFSLGDMDWGAWAWGFCCWPIGLFTVILNKDKDSNSKISYLIGFGCAVVLGIISNIVSYAAYGSLWYY
jgi:hypothetical protein